MFKVHDLMIDVLAEGRGGGVAMPTPTEPTPPSPISPIAVVASLEESFRAIDTAVDYSDRVDTKTFDDMALTIGRTIVTARIAAYLGQDEKKLKAHPEVAPTAVTGAATLTTTDFNTMRDTITDMSRWLNERGDLLEKRAVEQKKTLIPQLEAALDHLKKR